MTPEEVRDYIATIARMSQVVSVEDVDAVLVPAERYDTLGPILDPTAWQKNHHNVAEHATLLRAFRAFRTTIEEIKAREMARLGVHA